MLTAAHSSCSRSIPSESQQAASTVCSLLLLFDVVRDSQQLQQEYPQ
jgi:hypothetical protein